MNVLCKILIRTTNKSKCKIPWEEELVTTVIDNRNESDSAQQVWD
jgi:hypothetical protein